MIVRQYLHTETVVAASYLFGCGEKARGAVVDPVSEPEAYPTDEAAFVELMARDIPPRPERFAEIRAENLGRQPAGR